MKRHLSLYVILILALFAVTIQPTSAKIGTGHLYVYTDSSYTVLVPTDDKGFYEVLPDQTVFIQIAGIAEFGLGDWIIIKIGFEVNGIDYTYTTDPLQVKGLEFGVIDVIGLPGVGDKSQPIPWTVGDYTDPPPPGHILIPVCETITVHYKDTSGTGPEYITYDANPPCIVAHLHVIPENPLGTLGAISTILIGFGIYHLAKGRKTIPLPRRYI